MDEQGAKIKMLDAKCVDLEVQLEKKSTENKDLQGKYYELLRKQKNLEDLVTKMKNSQIPKLKNTIEY